MVESIELNNDIAQKLQLLLGAQAKDGWIHFMDFIERELSFLMHRGRPTKQQIENSIIGKKGYATWRAYLSTELKWKEATWKNWKKAYQLSKSYSYIRDSSLEVSELLRVSGKFSDFPKTYTEYQKCVEQMHHDSIASLSKSKKFLTEENNELKTLLTQSQKRNVELSNDLNNCTKMQNKITDQVKGLSRALPIESYLIADYWLAEVIRTFRLEHEILVKKFHEKSQEASTLRCEKAELSARYVEMKRMLSKTTATPVADIERFIDGEYIGLSG
jgi:hypothetical protein